MQSRGAAERMSAAFVEELRKMRIPLINSTELLRLDPENPEEGCKPRAFVIFHGQREHSFEKQTLHLYFLSHFCFLTLRVPFGSEEYKKN